MRARALIVDADESFLAFAAEALSSFRPGFEVATAFKLEQAEEWLETFRPDLLLLRETGDSAAGRELARIADDPRAAGCKVLTYGADRNRTDDDAVRDSPSLPVLLRAVRGVVDH